MYAEYFCALDSNVIRARYGGTKGRTNAQSKKTKKLSRKKRTKRAAADVGQKVGEKCTEVFETYTARVAHEVHARWLGGTRGLKLYVRR